MQHRISAIAFAAALVALAGPPAQARDTLPEDDVKVRLEDARERLEQTAREVAELSGRLAGESLELLQDFRFDERRAMLGINIGSAPEGVGVEVLGVTPGGPADEAGVRTGDILLSCNGEQLRDQEGSSAARQLVRLMREVEPLDEVSLTYRRAGEEYEVAVTAVELETRVFALSLGDEDIEFALPEIELRGRHGFPSGDFYHRWGRMELVGLTPALGSYFGTDEGLLVVRAPSEEELQLRDGDVILRIDGRSPRSPQHAMSILRSYESGESLSMDIMREQKRRTLEIEIPGNGREARRTRLKQQSRERTPPPDPVGT